MNELPKKVSEMDEATATALRERLSVEIPSHTITARLRFEQCAILSNGLISTATDHEFLKKIRTPLFIKIDRSLNETISLTYPEGLTHTVFFYDIKCDYLSSVTGTGTTASVPVNTHYLKIMFHNTDNSDLVANKEIYLTYVSRTLEPEYVKNKRISAATISFVYRTAYQKGGKSILVDGDDSPTQYPEDLVYNSGILRLPENYTQTGRPVRLIILNHGSAGYGAITVKEFYSTYLPYYEYLVAEGYAIFDCYAMTSKYGGTWQNFGAPTSMMAIVNGYKWVLDNYNIYDDGCFTCGKSQGGLPSALLCYNPAVPVLACGLLAPLIDPVLMMWGYSVAERLINVDDMNFTEDTEGVLNTLSYSKPWPSNLISYLTANAEKMMESSALWVGTVDVTPEEMIAWYETQDGSWWYTKKKVCKVPTKIWAGYDDGLNDRAYYKYYLMLRNGNSNVALRYIASGNGAHHAVDTTGPMITVDTKYGGTLENIPVAYAEMLSFFKQFDNV